MISQETTPSRPVAAVPARTTTATANNAGPRLRLFPRFISDSPRPTYYVLYICCVILWREEGGHDPTPMVVCDPGSYSPLGDKLRIRVRTIPSTKASSPSAGASSPR